MTGIAPGVYELPDGDQGTLLSVAMMREMARAASLEPLVRAHAAAILEATGPNACASACVAQLRAWLRDRVVYTLDRPDMEHTREPLEMLEAIDATGQAAGDCDCISVLAAALALAMGYRVRFLVEGYAGVRAPYEHIFAEVQAPSTFGWAQLDTVRDWLGDPPRATKRVGVPV